MIRVSKSELARELVDAPQFPKYTSGLVNLTNRFARGTVPAVVGQLTELIQECPHKDYAGWKRWYLDSRPTAVRDAVARIMAKLRDVKHAMENIDEELVRRWVEDLVLAKTFVGLRTQEAILRRVAKMAHKGCRLATPPEEAKGIDGFIGDLPVSIKPVTYKQMKHLSETMRAHMIFYEKTDTEFLIDASDVMRALEKQKTVADAV